MKNSIFLLVGAVVASPLVIALPTDSVAKGVVAEDVEIFVDASGKALSTATSITTIVEQPSSVAISPPAPTAQSMAAGVNAAPANVAPAPGAAAAAAAASVAPVPALASSSGSSFNSGIAYSPYTASGSCKSASQVASDVGKLSAYNLIRTYGTDCNQVANTLAAIGSNQRLFAGIFNLSSLSPETQSLISQVSGKWSKIHTVNVGNELVNSGAASVGAVTSAVDTTRSVLRAAGYKGPVVTVDTMNAVVANPALCQASDFCAINCHAFFDPSATASGAGSFVQGWVKKVQAIAGGKQVVVTESGWPTQGQANGAAVPSPQNQAVAVSSLKKSIPQNLILYSAFNTLWQANSPGTFNSNQYWGIYGNAPSIA